MIEKIKIANNELFKNSILIIFANIITAGIGFGFWIIAAKYYPKNSIGVATGLISSITLLILVSRLGFEQSIIKYFPTSKRNKILTTAAIITTIVILIMGIASFLYLDLWATDAQLNTYTNKVLYIIILLATSLTSLTTIVFIAARKAEFNLYQTLITSSRILFLIPLISYGSIGILGAVGIATIISLCISFVFILKFDLHLDLNIDGSFLKESFNYSMGNYLSGMLMNVPIQLIPIMSLEILGANDTANYYISYSIISGLLVIPRAFSLSLFVEGSHGGTLRKNTLNSMMVTILILIPAIILMCYKGDILLLIVKETYVESFELLQLLALSTIFVTICQNYVSIKRIQDDLKNLIFISGLVFFLLTGSSYLFMSEFGIIGIGYAWLFSYGFTSLIILFLAKKDKWI